MLYFAILMVSGTTQLLAGVTTDIHGDNVTALYTHGYGYHAPGNKVETNIAIILTKELG